MTGTVVVVGLGPAGPDLLTDAARRALDRAPARFVRTRRHPAAAAVGDAVSFDDVYEQADTLEAVYATIVDRLVDAAARHGSVAYAVPGSPLVAERTVELLRARTDVTVEVVPALSFLDLAWAVLGVDPLASGVRLVDGHRFAEAAARERGPLLVAQCDSPDVLSAIKLAVDDEPPGPVTVLQRLGLPDQTVTEVAWADLDRAVTPDHLTSLWIPELAVPVGRSLVRFHELVRTLREQCPWDREQTHHSLTRHLIEETYEVLEAIDHLDDDPATWDHLADELGDLLFQVEFHAVIAEQAGWFTMADVADGIHDKLVRRHPHVFGEVVADDADTVVANWEQIKKAERGATSIMEGIAGNLPSLSYAWKVQKKAASVGFDWPSVEGAWPKIAEEAGELRAAIGTDHAEAELGDLLFAVVNVARHLGIDPETALRGATARFRDRFMALEALAAARGLDLRTAGLAELDALWDEVKRS